MPRNEYRPLGMPQYAGSSFRPPGGPTGYDKLVASLGPSGWWKLADAVGSTTAADSSGNGYTGTVNGGVTFGEAGHPWWALGYTGALFDGSTGDITIATPAALLALFQDHDFTVTGWANPTSSFGQQAIFSLGQGITAGEGFGLFLNSGYWHATGAYQDIQDPTAATLSVWQQATATFVASTGLMTLYVNGGEVVSGSFASGVNVPTTTTTAYIGQGAWFPAWFDGDLAEVAVFDFALTAAQISQLYEKATT